MWGVKTLEWTVSEMIEKEETNQFGNDEERQLV